MSNNQNSAITYCSETTNEDKTSKDNIESNLDNEIILINSTTYMGPPPLIRRLNIELEKIKNEE